MILSFSDDEKDVCNGILEIISNNKILFTFGSDLS